MPIKKFRAMPTSRNSRVKHLLQVITPFRVGIPADIDLNFRQFITSGKLFFAKLSFGLSKESGLNRN
ncbi:MAG: hypothetical protein SGI89_00750 [bacterium]|nr:hypothetical protein [bacterium]